MKVSQVKVVNESVFTCDYCQKQMPFPTWTCAGCGLHTCNDSCNLRMIVYEAGRPMELDRVARKHGTGIHLPRLAFCEVCDKTHPLALVAQQIKAIDDKLIADYSAYRQEHYKLSGKAERLINKGIHED